MTNLLRTFVALMIIPLSASCTKPQDPLHEKPAIEAPIASDSVNCLDPKVAPAHSALCKEVVDPMKAERGEISVLDCSDELEDGYEAGICGAVSPSQQTSLKNKK